MTGPPPSFARRLRRAGNARLAVDRMAAAPPLCWLGRLGRRRVPDALHALARWGYDAAELATTRRWPPSPGNPEKAVHGADGPLPQHPRYRIYWRDDARRAAIGFLIGVDLVRSGGRFHVVEMNISTGLSAARRKIYDEPIDPVIDNLVRAARTMGFRSLVAVSRTWRHGYIDELEQAGTMHGVDARGAVIPALQPDGPHLLAALPDPPDSDTLYVVRSTRSSPLAHYVHDKACNGAWLPTALHEVGAEHTVAIPTSDHPVVDPADDPGPSWPNLVVKLAGSDRGRHVVMARARDADHAAAVLGLSRPGAIPEALRVGPLERIRRRLHGSSGVICQPFVPSELDPKGCASVIRLNVLITPVGHAFIGAHERIATRPVPDRVELGIVRDAAPFMCSIAHGTAVNTRIAPGSDLEAALLQVAGEIGRATRLAVERRFETVPS